LQIQSSVSNKNELLGFLLGRVEIGTIFDVLWGVALFGVGVVDLSQGASVLTGRDSVQTDVELLTIGMSVTRMDLCGTIGIELLLLGAGETIGQNFFADAAYAGYDGGPSAHSGCLVKDQIGRAFVQVSLTINAGEEFVAVAVNWMLEEAIQTTAILTRLGRLQKGTVSAFDVGHVIAFVLGFLERVEDESVLAEHLRGDAVIADVVFVALFFILVLAVFVWALELSGN